MEDRRQEPDGCSMPPELGDLALIAAVDGEADTHTMIHLRICQHCASRARDFAELQGLLRKRLYRMFCPTSDDLAAFHQGMLSGSQRTQIANHLAECPHCSGELRMLTEALGLPPQPRPPPAAGLRRIVAKLLAPAPFPPLVAAYGALRGIPSGGQYAYQAENLQLMLDVERAASRPGRLVLLGILLIDDSQPNLLRNASANLLRDQTIVGNAQLDDLGNFTLDNLMPGNYSLLLRLHDREVLVDSLIL